MNLEKLDKQILKRIRTVTRSGANFLSGTMAPAKADVETMDIECMAHAFEHYAKRGVEEVVVQPKYMGSRASVYIFRDIEDCYAISRNGYRIRGDLTEAFKERQEHWFTEENDHIKCVIEDAELMPWSFLGEGLIDKNFRLYETCAKLEEACLNTYGFNKAVSEASMKLLSKEEEFTSSEAKLQQVILNMPSAGMRGHWLQKFSHQLELFCQGGEPYFKPFSVLKVIYTDDSEDIFMDYNKDNFEYVSEDEQFVVNPAEWDRDSEAWINFITDIQDKELEGVVVKPSKYERSEDRELRYAPYLKVRNPEYLRIVYGPDYTSSTKLATLCEKKSIGRKVGASIKEYEIGRNLLEIPIGLLDNSNELYKELVAKALVQFQYDEQLDPRL